MIEVLRHPDYARLFAAQVVALIGTGLLTVALGLLAYDLAGDQAGAVLGTVFAIKMIAYVALAPVANALAGRWPRKQVLIGADIVRAAVALTLPFIDSVWQIYGLIFVLQAASATFTPAFQAVIPDILTEERDYTRALSLSRLAYDLENLLSPALAGILLVFISYHGLFGGTVLGFLGSALLVLSAKVPVAGEKATARPFVDRLTRGIRIYAATPRLHGLFLLNLTAAAAGAFVLVNTVVLVQGGYGAGESQVALALAGFGGGSMLAALALPRLLDRLADRTVMLSAGLLLTGLTLGHAFYLVKQGLPAWSGFLLVWALSGVFYSAILTPSGRLLRISAHAEDRPALFAAQFTLSHLGWLVTYSVAGWAGSALGLPLTMAILGIMALAGALLAMLVWPADDALEVEHEHSDLPRDHPHLREHPVRGARHRHVFVIDDEHRAWPTHG
ncbi:predicted MFS family arabinose efflux permease [Hoeflea halophila]|uniref:Predicted MFS family arabinose efflux permease n=1 Tax=Hoeflea halophila TaxID=714899 RepID=A0A286IBQ9_9HYPH|nr:MFS transporter [Hoeflea halophila]SOE16809.1 predicted MFS family arabinose efflux permease [Hoeflea halophila]